MKKQMRIKKFIPLLLIPLIGIGFFANSIVAAFRNEAAHKRRQQDGPFTWPAVGQAAIGTVEEGVRARSSVNEKQRPIASMAKVITALAIMEKQPFKPGQPGETYTITREDIESLNEYISAGGSALPVLIGMKLTQYQAMQRMLIASDNNMADILAKWIFGSQEAYLSYARDMLKRMDLSWTLVADASGFDAATVSTPSELVAIGIAALKNPVIAAIVAQPRAQLPVTGIIKNTNQLLGINGTIGIKTGTTDDAGSCLLFAARHISTDGKKRIIVGVIMGDTNHSRLYSDSKDLLASAKQFFGRVKFPPTGKIAGDSLNQRMSRPLKH